MKRRLFSLSVAAATVAISLPALAQTKWDLPAAYPATNFHTVNLTAFANDVDKATGGKLKITVHAGASLFKAPEIKRAVRDVMQHQNVERREVLEACGTHAVNHPPVKGVA